MVYLGEKVNIWLSTLGCWSTVALWDLNIESNSVRSSSCVLLSFFLESLVFNYANPLAAVAGGGSWEWNTCTGLISHKDQSGCLSNPFLRPDCCLSLGFEVPFTFSHQFLITQK